MQYHEDYSSKITEEALLACISLGMIRCSHPQDSDKRKEVCCVPNNSGKVNIFFSAMDNGCSRNNSAVVEGNLHP